MCVCVCVITLHVLFKKMLCRCMHTLVKSSIEQSSHLKAHLIEWVTAHKHVLRFGHVHSEMRRRFKELLVKVRSHS